MTEGRTFGDLDIEQTLLWFVARSHRRISAHAPTAKERGRVIKRQESAQTWCEILSYRLDAPEMSDAAIAALTNGALGDDITADMVQKLLDRASVFIGHPPRFSTATREEQSDILFLLRQRWLKLPDTSATLVHRSPNGEGWTVEEAWQFDRDLFFLREHWLDRERYGRGGRDGTRLPAPFYFRREISIGGRNCRPWERVENRLIELLDGGQEEPATVWRARGRKVSRPGNPDEWADASELPAEANGVPYDKRPKRLYDGEGTNNLRIGRRRGAYLSC
jgi:hypothetical protein